MGVTINLSSLMPRGTSFVLSDKGSKALFFVDTALIFFKYTLSPPATANLPKRFGLCLLSATHQWRTLLLFMKLLPACVRSFRSGEVFIKDSDKTIPESLKEISKSVYGFGSGVN